MSFVWHGGSSASLSALPGSLPCFLWCSRSRDRRDDRRRSRSKDRQRSGSRDARDVFRERAAPARVDADRIKDAYL